MSIIGRIYKTALFVVAPAVVVSSTTLPAFADVEATPTSSASSTTTVSTEEQNSQNETPTQEDFATRVDISVAPYGPGHQITAVTDKPVDEYDFIVIADYNTGDFIEICFEGTTCQGLVTTPGTYYAFTSQVQSETVAVGASQFNYSLALSTQDFDIEPGESAFFDAKLNTFWTNSDMVFIYDETAQKFIRKCYAMFNDDGTRATNCDGETVHEGDDNPHTFKAYFATANDDATDPSQLTNIRAVSNAVTVTNNPWWVTLSSDTSEIASMTNIVRYPQGGATGIVYGFHQTADNNEARDVAGYETYVFDLTNDERVNIGTNPDYPSTVIFPYEKGDSVDYQAIIASNANGIPEKLSELEDVKAVSNIVTIRKKPWNVNTTLGHPAPDTTYRDYNIKVAANQYISTFVAGSYTAALIDANTGEILRLSGQDSTSFNPPFFSDTMTFLYPDLENYPNETPTNFKVVVGLWSERENHTSYPEPGEDISGYMEDIQYDSGIYYNGPNGITQTPVVSNPVPSLAQPHKTTGGSNLSEPCPQTCSADPVNDVTGEFWETTKDISAGGVGNELNFIRSYSVSSAGTNIGLGYGWRSNWDMKLVSEVNAPLNQATALTVEQENGSLISFTKIGALTYSASPGVEATLKENNNGTYTFIRDKEQIFNFDADGKLLSTADLNGNTNTITRDSQGAISSVGDSRGRTLTFTYANGLISQIADQTGRRVNYTYDSSQNITGVSDVRQRSISYGYNAQHLITTMTNVLGGTTTNVYDGSRRVVKQTDPAGNETNFEYKNGYTTVIQANGVKKVVAYDDTLRVNSITQAAGTSLESITIYEYNLNSNLPKKIIDAQGNPTSYTYDLSGNRLTETDALGYVTTYTYDALDNPLTITDALGNTKTMTYDSRGNITSTTSAEGRKITTTYNADGTTATTTSARGNIPGANAAKYTTTFTYNANGNLSSIKDGDNNTSTLSSNSLGWVTSNTDARGKVTTFTYNNAGMLTSTTDANNNTTSTTYDNANNVYQVTDALNNKKTFVYNNNGLLLNEQDARGYYTHYTYDSLNRLKTIKNSIDNITSYSYDALGNRVTVTDPLGRISSSTYDNLGQLVSKEDSEHNIVRYQYGATGNILAITDAEGYVSRITYDALSRPLKNTDPDGKSSTNYYDKDGVTTSIKRNDQSVLSWTHDADGNVISSTDATGITSLATYDAKNNVLSATDRSGKISNNLYDAVGNLASSTATDGSVTTFTYDNVNQLTKTDYPGSTTDVTRVYDKLGRISSESAGSDTKVYTYDANGNLLRRGLPGNTGGVRYTYDALNRLSSLTYPGGRTVNYTYNKVNEPISLAVSGMGTVTNAFNSNGLLTSVTLPSGVNTTNEYNSNSQLVNTNVENSSGVNIYNKTNTYSPAGYISQMRTEDTSGQSKVNDISYDPLSRISSYEGSELGFDSRGNLTTRGTVTNTFESSGKQLTSVDSLSGNTTTYAYDNRGNRISSETKNSSNAVVTSATYNYDTADRLMTVSAPNAPPVSYGYDPAGMRTSRTQGTSPTTYMTWNMNSGIPTLLDDGQYEFIYQPGGYAPIAQISKSNGTVTYLHSDNIGTITAVSNSNGNAIASYSYDAYGKSFQSRVTPFGFAGQYQDSITKLYDFRARVYDSSTASFLQRDPAELMTDEPYAYASGNPTKYIDPLGLWSWNPTKWTADEWKKVGVGAVTAAAIVGGIACTLATAGICGGVIGAVVVTGLIGAGAGAATYGLTTDCATASGYFKSAAVGGIFGAIPIGGGLSWLGKTRIGNYAYDAIRGATIWRNIPVVNYPRHLMPELTAGIENAWKGGWIKSGAPRVLNRLEGKANINANRAPNVRGKPSIPGRSYDEYPLASTYQGGAGAHVTSVPRRENNIQGGIMSSFYQKFNIRDGDPFRIRITE